MKQRDSIETFIIRMRRRLNRHRAVTACLWSVGLCAGILLVVALGYIIRGYAVPTFWYPLTAGCIFLGALAGGLCRRLSTEEATQFADGAYDLRDAITSEQSFKRAQKSGGLYDLQAEATGVAVRRLKPEALKFEFPRGLAIAAVVLVAVAGLTAFKAPSEVVVRKLALEETTLALTEDFSENIERELNELEKGIKDPEERKLLETEEIRKWIQELEATRDQKKAMRQMANLERKLTQMANKMAQRKTEQLLAKAARELDKDRAHKELARKLKEQRYREAGRDLDSLKPKEKKLAERRKELAKLKSAAKRMSAAAKSTRSASKGKDGRGTEGREMKDLLESLEKDVENYENELEELELAELKGELTDEMFAECELFQGKIAGKLDLLNGDLSRLSAAKKLQGKLLGLCKKLGQCQGSLAGQCRSPFPGGREPGTGSVASRRSERDELVDNWQTTQLKGLKGLKGQGPSLTRLEAAEDGTGVSNRSAEAEERSFQRQFESFVQREDIPEDVKAGVKEYFTAIHEGGEPEVAEEAAAPAP